MDSRTDKRPKGSNDIFSEENLTDDVGVIDTPTNKTSPQKKINNDLFTEDNLKKKGGGGESTQTPSQSELISNPQLPLEENKSDTIFFDNNNAYQKVNGSKDYLPQPPKEPYKGFFGIDVSAAPKEFNQQFENITGYKGFDLTEPTAPQSGSLRGLLGSDLQKKREETFEEKKFNTYTKEAEKIDELANKVHGGVLSLDGSDIIKAAKNPFSKNVVRSIVSEYNPEAATDLTNPQKAAEASFAINAKNRVNSVNARKAQLMQYDEELKNDWGVLQNDNPPVGVDDFTKETVELKKNIPIPNLDDNKSISSAISKLQELQNREKIRYMGLPLAAAKSQKETENLIGKLKSRIGINTKDVSENISWLNDNIQHAVVSHAVTDNKDEPENDEARINQFKLGLSAIEYSDPVLFKNVTESLAKKSKVAPTDYSYISKVGQDIYNRNIFKSAAISSDFLGKETDFDYTTFEEKKAKAAGDIGEWMKAKGIKNTFEFSDKSIMQAAKELGIDKNIAQKLALEEALPAYDAIPKSGALDAIVQGMEQPIEGILSTVEGLSETPAETYLRSKQLSGTGMSQKVPTDTGYDATLQSEKGKFWTGALQGMGQFLTQVALAKGAGVFGGGAAKALNLGVKGTEIATIYGGTALPIYLQTYGQSYEQFLNQNGDPAKSSLMAHIASVLETSSELWLPDVKIANMAAKGLRDEAVDGIFSLIRKGGDPADIALKTQSITGKFLKALGKTANIGAQEIGEEVYSQIGGYVSQSILDPNSALKRDLNDEVWQTIKQTALSMALPSILGGGGSVMQKDFTVQTLHNSAINFDEAKEGLEKQLDKGLVTQDELNSSIKLLATHKQSIESAPDFNANGDVLNSKQKLDYALEDTKIKVYDDKIKNTTGVQKEMWEQKKKASEDVQREILIPETKAGAPEEITQPIELSTTVPNEKSQTEAKVSNATEEASTTNEAVGNVSKEAEAGTFEDKVRELYPALKNTDDAGVNDFIKENATDTPSKFINDFGQDKFNEVVKSIPTKELQNKLDIILDNNSDSKDVDILDKLISDRESEPQAEQQPIVNDKNIDNGKTEKNDTSVKKTDTRNGKDNLDERGNNTQKEVVDESNYKRLGYNYEIKPTKIGGDDGLEISVSDKNLNYFDSNSFRLEDSGSDKKYNREEVESSLKKWAFRRFNEVHAETNPPSNTENKPTISKEQTEPTKKEVEDVSSNSNEDVNPERQIEKVKNKYIKDGFELRYQRPDYVELFKNTDESREVGQYETKKIGESVHLYFNDSGSVEVEIADYNINGGGLSAQAAKKPFYDMGEYKKINNPIFNGEQQTNERTTTEVSPKAGVSSNSNEANRIDDLKKELNRKIDEIENPKKEIKISSSSEKSITDKLNKVGNPKVGDVLNIDGSKWIVNKTEKRQTFEDGKYSDTDGYRINITSNNKGENRSIYTDTNDFIKHGKSLSDIQKIEQLKDEYDQKIKQPINETTTTEVSPTIPTEIKEPKGQGNKEAVQPSTESVGRPNAEAGATVPLKSKLAAFKKKYADIVVVEKPASDNVNPNESKDVKFSVTDKESEAVSDMKDIVNDYMDNGVTKLKDIQSEVAKELGNDTPALKSLIEDAFNAAGRELKIADTDDKGRPIKNELTTSFAKRINSFVDKIFGKSDSPEGHTVILKDGKAVMDAANKVSSSRFQNVNAVFVGRDGKAIGFNYDTDQVARERFDISKLKQIGKGSDRTVFELDGDRVLKIAHTARGLDQNIHEGDYYLKGIVPEVYERGLNYVVTDNVARIKASDIVPTYDVETNEENGTARAGDMLNELGKFTQRDFDNKTNEIQDVINKYGFGDILSYDVLYNDFKAGRNWGYKDGMPLHIDGGTFGGVDMIDSYKNKAPLSDPEFRDIYNKSRAVKKEYGDTDKHTKFMKDAKGDVLGFTDPTTGKIYLNGEKLNPNTPVHEAGHLWTNWAKENDAPLHKRGLELTENSKYLKKVKDNKFYQDEAAKLPKSEQENYYREEALASAIGDKGAQFVSESRKKSFTEWAKQLWDNVAKAAGFKGVSAKEVQDMTLDEFSKRAATDILKGEPIKSESGKGNKPPIEGNEVAEGYEGDKIGQRRFTKQVLADEAILPKDQIAKRLDYVVRTNEMTINEATKIINDIGVDEAYDVVVGNRDVHPAVRTTMGQMLIKKFNNLASQAKDEGTKNYYWDKTIDIANFVSEKLGTEAGQSIQAFSLYSRLSPEAQLRGAIKQVKEQSASNKKKSERDVNSIGDKFKKVNEETAEAITKSKKVKDGIDSAESKRVVSAKNKIQKARERRDKIIKKYKSEKGKNLYSGVGLTKEGIEFVGDLAKTYIDEGIANLQILAEKIKENLKSVSGKDIPDDVNNHITSILKPLVEVAENTKIAKSFKELEKDIHTVIKEHYTVPEETKTTLINKFMNKVGLEESDAKELAKVVEEEFDKTATRRKEDILEKEKTRFERIQNKLGGAKKVEKKTLQAEAIRFSNLGAFDNNQLLEMLSEKLGTGQLTAEQGKEIQRLAERIEKAPEGRPKNEATEDLLTYRASIKGTNWAEVAQGVWYANVLSGYLTHIKNIVSTGMNGFAFFSVEAARDPKSIPFLLYGGAKGFKRGAIEAGHTLKTGRSPIHVSKIELPNILERVEFKGGYLNPANYLKFVGRLMVGEDVLQFQGLKEMRATQLAYREAKKMGYKNPFNKKVWDVVNDRLLDTPERYKEASEQAKLEGVSGREAKRRIYELMEQSRPIKMTEDAYGFAAKGTFNHATEGTLGALTNWISKGLDMDVGGARPLRFLVPFTRIITNVANNTLDFSPIGFVRAARNQRGFEGFKKSQLFKDQYHVMTKEERQQTLAKASLGILSMAGLYALAALGKVEVTGSGPDDIKKKLQLMQGGWQDYSIKIGDKYYSYKLTPMVFAWGVIGSIRDHQNYDKSADEETILQRTALAAWDGIKNIGDMTWVNSAAPIMGALSSNNPGEAGALLGNVGRNVSKSFLIPNAYTQSAQRLQNIFNMPQKQVNNAFESLIMDVPIARNTLNDKINALGDPIVRDVDILVSQEKKDPVFKYLLDKKGWVAPVNKRTLIVFDFKTQQDRPVTDDEYYKFSKLRGSKIKEGIADIMENGAMVKTGDTYIVKSAQELTSAELNKLLTPIKTKATKETKQELFSGAEGDF